jgi:predicted nucleic acid-binding protein
MPDPGRTLVINTGTLIALTAATGSLDVLRGLYDRLIVPFEVCQEISAGNASRFGVEAFAAASWLDKRQAATSVSAFLRNALDPGEASVIHTAVTEGVPLVAIDEAVGRRFARLHGLQLTGSLGILIRAVAAGCPLSLPTCIENMERHGIWLSRELREQVLKHGRQ